MRGKGWGDNHLPGRVYFVRVTETAYAAGITSSAGFGERIPIRSSRMDLLTRGLLSFRAAESPGIEGPHRVCSSPRGHEIREHLACRMVRDLPCEGPRSCGEVNCSTREHGFRARQGDRSRHFPWPPIPAQLHQKACACIPCVAAAFLSSRTSWCRCRYGFRVLNGRGMRSAEQREWVPAGSHLLQASAVQV